MSTRIDDEFVNVSGADGVDAPSAPAAGIPALPRRGFLTSVGALVGGTACGAGIECQDGELSICRLPDPRLPLERWTLHVTLNGKAWDISLVLFGLAARTKLSYSPDDDRYVLQLSRAVCAATDLRISFTAQLFRSGGNCTVRLNFVQVGAEVTLALADWIEGKVFYAGQLAVTPNIRLAHEIIRLRPL